MSNPLIDLETARALVARGWSVVPTASDAEKRPQGNFATAKSWRDFSDRLPTDSELLDWFGPKPRRGGVVLHKGQFCVDRDTKDSLPDGSAPWEETDHGSHEFFQCTAETKPSHDHDAKIDYLTYGSFVRLANPQCLLDWEGDLPRWEDGMTKPAVEPAVETAAVPLSGGTIRDTLIAQGWKPIGIHGNREDFSRPGAAHPTRRDASLFDGSSFKVWSTAAMAPNPAGAGASSLQRYVQTIARISQDKSGAYWFNALCREFDDPFTPVLLRAAPSSRTF